MYTFWKGQLAGYTITTILQINNSEAQLSELLSHINTDIKEDGVLDSQTIINEITTNSTNINSNSVIQNLQNRYQDLGETVNIPDFYYFIDSDNNGILNGDEVYDLHENQTSSGYSLDTSWMYYQPDYLELDGVLYSAFPDKDNNNQITVLKLENDEWTNLNVNITKEARYPNIEVDSNGNLYVFFYEQQTDGTYYSDYSGTLNGYCFDGSSWINILEESIDNYFDDLETTSSGDDIYIIYGNTDDNQSAINVRKFNVIWSDITPSSGIPQFSGDFSSTTNGQGNLYIAYRGYESGHFMSILEYSSNTWEQLGSVIPGDLAYPHLVFNNNQLYVLSSENNEFRVHENINGSWVEETYLSDIRYHFSVLNRNEIIYITSIEFTDNFGTIPTIRCYSNSTLTEIDLSSIGYSGMSGPTGVWFNTVLLPYGIDSNILMYPNIESKISGLEIILE